jgi:REP element-mobilizing transposase RayT
MDGMVGVAHPTEWRGLMMPNYRRRFFPGGMFFFTVVTAERRRLFCDAWARRCLRRAMALVRAERPFETTAIVLLPEHLHCIWQLPEGDADFSTRWACPANEMVGVAHRTGSARRGAGVSFSGGLNIFFRWG